MSDKRHTHILNLDDDVEVTITSGRKDRFFRFMHWIVDSGLLAEMPQPAVKAYLVIGRYSDFTNGTCVLSGKRICREAGIGRTSLNEALRVLVGYGLISRMSGKSRRVDQANMPNRYRVHLDDPRPAEHPPCSSGDQGRPVDGQGVSRQATNPSSSDELSLETTERETQTRETATARLLREAGFTGKTARALDLKAGGREDLLKTLLRNLSHLESKGKIRSRAGYIRKGLEEEYDLLPELAGKDLQADRSRRACEAADRQRRQRQEEKEQARRERRQMLEVINRLSPQRKAELLKTAIDTLPVMLRRGIKDNPDPLSNLFVRTAVYNLAKEEIAHGR